MPPVGFEPKISAGERQGRLRNIGAGWMRRDIYYIEVISLAVEAYLSAVFHLAVPGLISY